MLKRQQITYWPKTQIKKTVLEINAQTKLPIKEIQFFTDGTTIKEITNFNKLGQKIKTTYYRINGRTVWYINEYNQQNGELTKETFFYENKKVNSILEYDHQTLKCTKEIYFEKDGKTIKDIANITTTLFQAKLKQIK